MRNAASAVAVSCVLRKTEVEIVDNTGLLIRGPANSVTDTVTYHVLGWPVNFNATVALTAPPPGGSNLAGSVAWSLDTGRGMNFRLHYFFDQPAGVDCEP